MLPPKSDIQAEYSPYLVGILNLTPDSFSDGGKFSSMESILAAANLMREQGCHILELGGESTAPGSQAISAQTEWERIASALKALAKDSFLSVDTFHSETAKRALELGVSMINDVSGLRYDPQMAEIIADFEAHIVIMHSKQAARHPHADLSSKEYADIVSEIGAFLSERAEFALSRGIREEKIILDPGMGLFLSPDSKYSWQLLGSFERLCELLRPFRLMIGTSRKGFLGLRLEQRDFISQLSALIAFEKGATFIRTHNIGLAKELLRVRKEWIYFYRTQRYCEL